MTLQLNVAPEKGQEPKYEVGAYLIFVKYNEEEISYAPFEEGQIKFAAGDVLVVEPKNGCGMGIDVKREKDGHIDMVWPEEVRLIN